MPFLPVLHITKHQRRTVHASRMASRFAKTGVKRIEQAMKQKKEAGR